MPTTIPIKVIAIEGRCPEVLRERAIDPERMISVSRFGSGSKVRYRCGDKSIALIYADDQPCDIFNRQQAMAQSEAMTA